MGKIKKNVLLRSFELDAKKKGTNSKEWVQNCPCTVSLIESANILISITSTISPSTIKLFKTIYF